MFILIFDNISFSIIEWRDRSHPPKKTSSEGQLSLRVHQSNLGPTISSLNLTVLSLISLHSFSRIAIIFKLHLMISTKHLDVIILWNGVVLRASRPVENIWGDLKRARVFVVLKRYRKNGVVESWKMGDIILNTVGIVRSRGRRGRRKGSVTWIFRLLWLNQINLEGKDR